MIAVKRIGLITILLIFLLLLLGGVVHNTESSLACPDWPLCYGQFFPEMKGGVLIEHSHRLLASLVGFMTILLVYFSAKERKKSEEHLKLFRLSFLALILVVLQGILGGITVLYRLPTIVSTSHLGLSMAYFLVIILIQHRSSNLSDLEGRNILWPFPSKELMERFEKNYSPLLGHVILLSLALIYSQILLGAFMRHAGAGTSCGVGHLNAIQCFDTSVWLKSWIPTDPRAQLHMFHRFWGVIVFLFLTHFLGKSFIFFWKKSPLSKILIAFPFAIIACVTLQIFLGVLTVAEALAVIPTTAHLGVGALLLALVWKYYLFIYDYERKIYPAGGHSFFSDVISLTKPKLSLLVMVTVLVGVLVTSQSMNFFKVLLALVLIGMVVAGAATLNCYLEKDIDAKMERTKNRPLPSQRMAPLTALLIGLFLLGFSIPLIFIKINVATGFLAVVAALSYLYAYTPLKQKSLLAVFVGAIPGAIPPLMGRTTVLGEFDFMGLLLFAILYVWQIPHFFAISIYHREDYNHARIKIFPTLWGMKKTKFSMILLTVLLMLVSILPHFFLHASVNYYRVALALGLIFIFLSLQGLKKIENIAEKQWAQQYFWASIFYLPLLLVSMIYFN